METENKTRKVGPPNWMIRVVLALTPHAQRDVIEGAVREDGLPPTQCFILAAQAMAGTVSFQMREAFSIVLIAGEACALYISFAGEPLIPVLIIIVVSLFPIRVRDAYIHPAKGSAHEAAADALFV